MSVPVGEGLVRVRNLTRALDSAVRIPGTNITFGLDALLGLVPGFGDVTTAAMAGVPLAVAPPNPSCE